MKGDAPADAPLRRDVPTGGEGKDLLPRSRRYGRLDRREARRRYAVEGRRHWSFLLGRVPPVPGGSGRPARSSLGVLFAELIEATGLGDVETDAPRREGGGVGIPAPGGLNSRDLQDDRAIHLSQARYVGAQRHQRLMNLGRHGVPAPRHLAVDRDPVRDDLRLPLRAFLREHRLPVGLATGFIRSDAHAGGQAQAGGRVVLQPGQRPGDILTGL